MDKIATPAPTPSTEKEWLEQREHFKTHGFVYLKDFFTADDVQLLHGWAKEIGDVSVQVLEEAAKGEETLEQIIKRDPSTPVVVPEAKNPMQVCRAEDFVTPRFGKFLPLVTKVEKAMLSMFGEDYSLFKEKLNFKWPGGGAFPPHQDFPAYNFLDPTFHATGMLSIDPSTIQNGCLRVARSWTKTVEGDAGVDQELLKDGRAVLPYHKGGKDNGTLLEEYSDRMDWYALNTVPTELVIFSSFVPHFSEPNGSDKSRRAMFLTFNKTQEGDQHAKYYETKRNDPKNPMFHIATPTQHTAQ